MHLPDLHLTFITENYKVITNNSSKSDATVTEQQEQLFLGFHSGSFSMQDAGTFLKLLFFKELTRMCLAINESFNDKDGVAEQQRVLLGAAPHLLSGQLYCTITKNRHLKGINSPTD